MKLNTIKFRILHVTDTVATVVEKLRKSLGVMNEAAVCTEIIKKFTSANLRGLVLKLATP